MCTPKCPKCKTEFKIPADSTESAGDNQGNFLEWAVKDIFCPKCYALVFKAREHVYEAGPGPW